MQNKDVPFGGIALLLDLGEDAVGLVIDAVRAGWQLAVALDLLLPAHVTGLVRWDQVSDRDIFTPLLAALVLVQQPVGLVRKIDSLLRSSSA